MNAQRSAALATANAVRTARAQLKDTVHADPSWKLLIKLVSGTPPRKHSEQAELARYETMRVYELLIAAPGIGSYAARAAVRSVDVALWRSPESVTLQALGPRRRILLAAELMARRRRCSDSYLRATARHARKNRRDQAARRTAVAA